MIFGPHYLVHSPGKPTDVHYSANHLNTFFYNCRKNSIFAINFVNFVKIAIKIFFLKLTTLRQYMNYRHLFYTLIGSTLISIATAQSHRKLQYHPDGFDIVCHDGHNRYTRALYGGYTDFRVETSDRPIFATYRRRS